MVTLQHIRSAQQRIRGLAARTPLVPFPAEDGRRIFLKLESLQPTGAFKLRGAFAKLTALSAQERARGVITYSSGNHAQALAYAARHFGVPAVIVIPAASPSVKKENAAALGADLVLVGPASSERQQRAEQMAEQHGYILVPPFNDEDIIAGQGTLALEILEDLPEVECVLAPVSGGGLISGVAAALKLSRPDVKVIGVEPELAADAGQSFRSGHIERWSAEDTGRTLADGLRTQAVGEIPFEHIRVYVDDMITVSEDEIREAMRLLVWKAHLVAEPSGAVSLAALLFHSGQLPPARHNVAVISGGNVDPQVLLEVISASPLAS